MKILSRLWHKLIDRIAPSQEEIDALIKELSLPDEDV